MLTEINFATTVLSNNGKCGLCPSLESASVKYGSNY